MFQALSQKFSNIFDKLKGRGLLNEADIDTALKGIRLALIEADVALSVVKQCFESVRAKAISQEVLKSLQPDQIVVKIVYDELVRLLGGEILQNNLSVSSKSPFSYMMVGLQGAGKTTTTAKLALNLKSRFKILMCSLDVYRPAAREQLAILGRQISIPVFQGTSGDPLALAKGALAEPGYDLILFDTAGRLHIDESMMEELNVLKTLIQPKEILLVVDALMGQDAARVSLDFHKNLTLSGVILTRLDGDSRGGAALSMTPTGVPIKYMGVGENVSQLEVFDPKRVASRILDMGDVVSLVETTMKAMEGEDSKLFEQKLKKGTFDLEDMANHLGKMMKMGGVASLLKFIPGMGKFQIPEGGDLLVKKQMSLITSMTPLERRNPKILQASRKRRIAKGAGQDVASLNRLLKQFAQMQIMMKHLSNEKNIKRGGLSRLLGMR